MAKYISSNTDQQTIATFDLGRVSSVHFEVQQTTNNYIYDTTIDIVHNGLDTFDFQQGFSSNSKPTLITSSIIEYEGCLITTPPAANTVYIIKQREVECNLYSQATQSGFLLLDHIDGFSIDFDSSLKSISIRDSANVWCEYTSPNTYISSNTLGPTLTGNVLIGNTYIANTLAWTSYNGSQAAASNTEIISISSGQIDNSLYASANVVIGRAYKVSLDAYHTDANSEIVQEVVQRALGNSKIRVGSLLSSDDYYSNVVSGNVTTFETVFVATTNTAFVSFGYGARNSRCYVSNVLLQEYAPNHLYDHDKGTIVLGWNTAPSSSVLLRYTDNSNTHTRTFEIDASNNVIIIEDSVSVVIGSQAAGLNKLAYSYDISNTSSNVSLNGTSNTIDITTVVGFIAAEFVSAANSFVYLPVALPTANLEVLT